MATKKAKKDGVTGKTGDVTLKELQEAISDSGAISMRALFLPKSLAAQRPDRAVRVTAEMVGRPNVSAKGVDLSDAVASLLVKLAAGSEG